MNLYSAETADQLHKTIINQFAYIAIIDPLLDCIDVHFPFIHKQDPSEQPELVAQINAAIATTKLPLTIAFSYVGLNVACNYDYHYMLIRTNDRPDGVRYPTSEKPLHQRDE